MNSQDTISENLTNAVSEGVISEQSQAAIGDNLDDIALAGCGGVDIDDIDSEEVTLVVVAIDASGSMFDHTPDVIKAYQEQFLKPLQGAKNSESILISTLVFSAEAGFSNVRLVHGYTPAPQCSELTEEIYQPNGGTPLYDAVWNSLTGLVAYGQNLRDNGTRTKSIVVVISDGWENSSKVSSTKVRRLSADVLRQQEFILSYVFFGDPSEGDKHATEIGFPAHHRLTEGLNDSGIRRVFGQVSASVITTSQTLVSAGAISANPFFAQNP